MLAIPPPLSDYIQRLKEISHSNDPSALLAHSYVRYLGDLSGGQILRYTVAKAYNLDETTGIGISYYSFKELRSSKAIFHDQGEINRIKEWFREGINIAGEKSVEVKATVVTESHSAYILNSHLLNMLRPKEQEVIKGELNSEQHTPSANTVYPLSTILAVVGAACLAHFILVVGGFTGKGGYEKLVTIQQWLPSLWQQTTD